MTRKKLRFAGPVPNISVQCKKCNKWTTLTHDDICYCAYCGSKLWSIEIHQSWCIGGEKGPCSCGANERQTAEA